MSKFAISGQRVGGESRTHLKGKHEEEVGQWPRISPTITHNSTTMNSLILALLALLGPVTFLILRRRSPLAGSALLSPVRFRDFPLVHKTPINSDTSVYRFALPRSSDILQLPVGQHILVRATVDGKSVTRAYTPVPSCPAIKIHDHNPYDDQATLTTPTLSNSDDGYGYFDLIVKTFPTGNVTRHIASLPLGSSISVLGPVGNFLYTPNLVSTLNMIAGGTGIAPMYQLMCAIAKNPADRTKVNLIYANNTEDEILLRREIDALVSQSNNRFKAHYVLTSPPPDGHWAGGVGYITKDIIEQNCAPPPPINLMDEIEAASEAGTGTGSTQSQVYEMYGQLSKRSAVSLEHKNTQNALTSNSLQAGSGTFRPFATSSSSGTKRKSVKLLISGPPPMLSATKKAAVDLGYDKPRAVSKLEDQVFVFS